MRETVFYQPGGAEVAFRSCRRRSPFFALIASNNPRRVAGATAPAIGVFGLGGIRNHP
jgi:hypothetical protein